LPTEAEKRNDLPDAAPRTRAACLHPCADGAARHRFGSLPRSQGNWGGGRGGARNPGRPAYRVHARQGALSPPRAPDAKENRDRLRRRPQRLHRSDTGDARSLRFPCDVLPDRGRGPGTRRGDAPNPRLRQRDRQPLAPSRGIPLGGEPRRYQQADPERHRFSALRVQAAGRRARSRPDRKSEQREADNHHLERGPARLVEPRRRRHCLERDRERRARIDRDHARRRRRPPRDGRGTAGDPLPLPPPRLPLRHGERATRPALHLCTRSSPALPLEPGKEKGPRRTCELMAPAALAAGEPG
jgi:hypothetical protein